MGITAPERAIDSYPHQFSGGMRQRVMLALGFSNEPALLIADEPTTALDVTIQAQILDLIRELNRDFGAAIILISHALGVIASVCQRVLVMYAGEIVEEGPTESVLANPFHPYTWALINAVPRVDREMPETKRLITIEGAPPDPMAMTAGCRFQERCPFRVDKCGEHPPLEQIAPGRKARCWLMQSGEPLPGTSPSRSAETAVPASARTGWIVQVGALESESEAMQRIEAAKSQARGLLNKADSFTEPVVSKDNRKLFRARFAGLERDQAEAVCRALKRADISCITVRN